MCIAIVKPKGIKNLTKKQLKVCWENNPDGAGFMYNDGVRVTGIKGFMTFEDFWSAYSVADKEMNLKNKDVVIHFRIATHGGISPECTHPFPVTDNIEDMRKHVFVSKAGFAHNGILSGWGNNKEKISDTMDYCAHVIAKIKYLEIQDELIHQLAKMSYSRFALLFPDKFIIGGNWVKHDNIYYSNDTYKERKIIIVPQQKKSDVSDSYDEYYADLFQKYGYYMRCYRSGNCDYCGKYGDLYTDGYVNVCKECKELDEKDLDY